MIVFCVSLCLHFTVYQHNSNSNYQRNTNSQHQSANDYLGGFESQTNQMPKMYSKWENASSDIRKWADEDDFMRDTNIWEKRRRTPNTTPASTVLNSPDFNEMHQYSHNVQHQIKVGRSPVNQHDHNKEKNNPSPVSPIQTHQRASTKRPATLVSDGEIVVFDDIDKWRSQHNEKNMATSAAQNKQSQPQIYSNSKSQSSRRFNHMLFDDDDDDERESNNTNSFSTENVTKMIGKCSNFEFHNGKTLLLALFSLLPAYATVYQKLQFFVRPSVHTAYL